MLIGQVKLLLSDAAVVSHTLGVTVIINNRHEPHVYEVLTLLYTFPSVLTKTKK